MTLLGDEEDGLFVERDECFATEPSALVGYHGVGEVTAGSQKLQSSLNGRPIDRDIRGRKQGFEGCGNIFALELVDPA